MIRKILLKTILKIKGDKSWDYYKILRKNQFDSTEKIQKRQLKKLQKLTDKAWEFEVYRKLWKKKPVINRLQDLRKLKPISKADFRSYKFKGIKDSTSGSSGEPFEFYLDKCAIEKKKARGFLSYELAGIKFDDKFCILWGIHNFDGWKGKIYRKWIHRTLVLSAFDMDKETMEEYVVKLNQYKPKTIQAYTSAIFALAQFMERNKMKLKFRLKSIVTSGETLTKAQRKLIERTFRCKIINRYGSREFGCIAEECEKGNMHIMEDLIVESRTGELLITDLGNFVMPFVRYKIGDSGDLKKGICDCGRGLLMLKEIRGRVSEYITSPSGEILSLHFLTLLFQEHADEVRHFQAVQKSKDLIEILIVPIKKDWGLKKEIKKKLEKEIDMKIKVKFVENISLTKTGKRRLILKDNGL